MLEQECFPEQECLLEQECFLPEHEFLPAHLCFSIILQALKPEVKAKPATATAADFKKVFLFIIITFFVLILEQQEKIALR